MPARHRGKHQPKVVEEVIEDEFEEEEDDEDEYIPSCYSWCGNPDYPKCMDSCKMWDD